MTVQLLRRSFTVDEYDRMVQAGIFKEDDRIELIAGEIVQMAPIGSRHAACVKRLNQLFSQRVGSRALVSVQDPLRLEMHSEPQPDLALIRPRPDYYALGHPGPGDTLLVIEVAESSGEPDRQVKIPLYARAGVPEVWLVDLATDMVEVYRRPAPQGYQETQRLRRGQRVATQGLPDVVMSADDILGEHTELR